MGYDEAIAKSSSPFDLGKPEVDQYHAREQSQCWTKFAYMQHIYGPLLSRGCKAIQALYMRASHRELGLGGE